MIPLLIVFAALSIATPLCACVCAPSTPKDDFKRSDIVFVGRVVSFGEMEVLQTFKGPRSVRLQVETTDSSCGVGLEPGAVMLVFATREQPITLGQCNVRRGELAECEIAFLRSRAAWWRSPLSSLRILKWLGVRWNPCPQREQAALSPFLLPSAA